MIIPIAGGRSAPALLLFLIALALRAADFGNPVIHVDEQYYLLVGDRLLHGAVPYLTIWDRKPIGLFLLFSGIRLLPGDGIIAYQLVATCFAWATAATIAVAAGTLGANRRGRIAAGALYLLMLSLLGGRGGQSPVFYNLAMAIGGALTLRLPILAARRERWRIMLSACFACSLAGAAIQMKYTPAIEGAFFGLTHLWFLRRAGGSWLHVVTASLLLAGIGLLPTLAAAAWYATLGPAALAAFWFANFTSIGLRQGYPAAELAMRLLGIAAQLAPLTVCAVLTWRSRRVLPSAALVALGWMAAALAGFLAIGTFFDHYALPLLVPLTIVAAPTLGRSARLLTASAGLALLLFAVERAGLPDDAPGARQVARVVRANSGNECPYVFIGDTITYLLARTCLPTDYAFPNLLAYRTEQGATGIDEAAEVARILAGRPPVIVTSTRRLSIWNLESVRLVKSALARDYRPVFATARSKWRTVVYLRRDRTVRR